MPIAFDVVVDAPPRLRESPARLHGLACALFEGAAADHDAQTKPWTVWPLRNAGPDGAGPTVLRLTWLRDDVPPPTGVHAHLPPRLRLGSTVLPVVRRESHRCTYAELGAAMPLTEAVFSFHTPTYFRRNDRDLPFPDPVRVIDSLASRWNCYAGTELAIDVESRTDLLDAVELRDFDLESASVDGPGGRPLRGAVGEAVYGLVPGASWPAQRLFAALVGAAEWLGVGKDTTRGLGVVTADPSPRGAGRPPEGRPRAGRRPRREETRGARASEDRP